MVIVVSPTSACLLGHSGGTNARRTGEKHTSMKRKLFLTALSLGITSALLVAATTRAADDDPKSSSSSSSSSSKSDPSSKPDQGGAGSGSSTISGMSQKITRVTQLTNAQVKSSSGETLGQV